MPRSESFWHKVQDGEQPFAGRATGHSTTCCRHSSFCTSLRQSFSQRPGSRSGSTAANTDAQTAQQSTRSERRDRCLANAHFNLNEPRTALRKHKVGDWNGQETVARRERRRGSAGGISSALSRYRGTTDSRGNPTTTRRGRRANGEALQMQTGCQGVSHFGARSDLDDIPMTGT